MIINIKLPKLPSNSYYLDFTDELAANIQFAIEELNAGEEITSCEVVGMSKDSISLDINITEYK